MTIATLNCSKYAEFCVGVVEYVHVVQLPSGFVPHRVLLLQEGRCVEADDRERRHSDVDAAGLRGRHAGWFEW